jgi:prepilin-type N-terminal cleavage/methylation domain-containing protein
MTLNKKNISPIQLGFSLIELLVVVAIIGILAGIAIVGYNSYVDSAKDSVNEANSSQLARKIAVERTKPTDFVQITSDYPYGCGEPMGVPSAWQGVTADDRARALANAAACWAQSQNYKNLAETLTNDPAAGELSVGPNAKVYWKKIDGTLQPAK